MLPCAQETFDEAVKTNMEDFEMAQDDAVKSAVEEFAARFDMSCVVTSSTSSALAQWVQQLCRASAGSQLSTSCKVPAPPQAPSSLGHAGTASSS